MPLLSEELVRQIHAAPGQVVLVLNGGSRAVAELLEVPGGSKILLEAACPTPRGPDRMARQPAGTILLVPDRPGHGRRRLRPRDSLRGGGTTGRRRVLHRRTGDRSAETRPPSRPRRRADRRPDAALVAGVGKRRPQPPGRGTNRQPHGAQRRGRGLRRRPSDWNCRCWSRNGSRSNRLPRRRRGRICSWAASRPFRHRLPLSPAPSTHRCGRGEK